jgi:hypothetical protein
MAGINKYVSLNFPYMKFPCFHHILSNNTMTRLRTDRMIRTEIKIRGPIFVVIGSEN